MRPMTRKRTVMRKIREVLRLSKELQLSDRRLGQNGTPWDSAGEVGTHWDFEFSIPGNLRIRRLLNWSF